jgi:tetratricopeptide (TPR) repeat protein
MPDPNLPSAAPGPAPHPGGLTSSVADPQGTTADQPDAATPAAPATGAGRYALDGEIARGGMGVIYRGTDTALGREVAVKVLQERFAPDAGVARRFADEARIAAQLQHPGIPPVHDLGTLPDGRPFLAMKLIKGQTLEALLNARPDVAAERGRFVAVFEQVCQALAYAHAHQVIHRDLKPANVMVGAFGEVQVMDWGLAKVLTGRPAAAADPGETTTGTRVVSLRDSDGSFTQAGSVLGTPAFMPPEQAAGALGKVGARSDVFGLGAVLAVILTGRPPFAAGSAETVRVQAAQGKLEECFARLDGCGADPELVALGKRCLAPSPAERPADAGEVARAVGALRAAAEERARRAELERVKAEGEKVAAQLQAAEQRKRRRVQLALAAAVLALLGLAGLGLWYHDRQANESKAAAYRNREAAQVALDQAEAALRQDNPVYGEIDAALTQARTRLADAGQPDLTQRFEDLSRARNLLGQLDEIDNRRWQAAAERGGRLDTEYARSNYPARFRDYGLDLSVDAPEQLAERIRRSPIAPRLTAALNTWMQVDGPPQLLALLDALDPDPERRSVRAAFARRDTENVAAWAAKLDGRKLPPEFAQFVGGHELTPQEHALRMLTVAQATHPNHFGLANQTARRFKDHQQNERIAYFRIALALRPANAVCWNNLGDALHATRNPVDAEAAFREAIRLDPNNARPHTGLGNVLFGKKNYDGALVEFREANRLDPTYAVPLNNIGNVLRSTLKFDEAIKAYKKANEVEPTFVLPLVNLGQLLRSRGDIEGAIAAFREAIDKNPNYAGAHYALGHALLNHKKDLDGAISAYRETVKLEPHSAPACNTLAGTLCQRGEPLAARQVLRDGVKRNPDWLNTPQTWVRYNIACSALLAAAGKGQRDTAKADPPALRPEALDALTADLAAWRSLWSTDPVKNRALVHYQMEHWLGDADLGEVRNVEGLPGPERDRWRILWEDVRQLRDETAVSSQPK